MKKRLVDCLFRCPDGRHVDFNVWPRKGESNRDACRRRLKKFVKNDRSSLCEEVRIRSLDKAGTRYTLPIRFSDRKPKVRIVRED